MALSKLSITIKSIHTRHAICRVPLAFLPKMAKSPPHPDWQKPSIVIFFEIVLQCNSKFSKFLLRIAL